MKLELKGSNIDNASNNNIGKATLVSTLYIGCNFDDKRSISWRYSRDCLHIAGGTEYIIKEALQEITCATSKSTDIAYNRWWFEA